MAGAKTGHDSGVAKNRLLVDHRRFGDANIGVRSSVVQQIAITPAYHAFDENHIRNLPNFLPLLFRSEDRRIASRNETTGIFAIENRDAGSIDQVVVGAVVN